MYVEAYETLSESLLQHALCRVCNRSLYIIMQHRLHAFGHRVVSCWVRPRPRRSAPRIATSSSLVRSNNGSPRFTDFPSLCACSESSLTNLIGSGLNLLCLQIHSKPKCRWTWPEVAILGADQKKRRLWGRKCVGYWKLNQWACPALDYQPLFRKGARAPTPGRNVDQTRESGGNRAKGCPGATLLHVSSNIGKTTATNQTTTNRTWSNDYNIVQHPQILQGKFEPPTAFALCLFPLFCAYLFPFCCVLWPTAFHLINGSSHSKKLDFYIDKILSQLF